MIFDITDEEMKNLDIINVILGIAGASKSSSLHPYLTKMYGEYTRATSTHSLRRDAMRRYPGVECVTVAGGLFTTNKGLGFYHSIKELDGVKCIVIDEVLQCDVQRVVDFCEYYKGKIKIIICTDDKQMLVPVKGDKYLTIFNEFCKREYVKVTRLTKTFRTIQNGKEDKELTAIYEDCYKNADNDDVNLYKKYKDKFPHISYEELIQKPFNPSAVYITYTNEQEEALYIDYKLNERRDADIELIPKGNIASDDDVDNNRYSIACQNQAERLNLTSYLQYINIGTTTRMQGREVKEGQICYLILPNYMTVSNRGFYTDITRCQRKSSIIIVDYQSPKSLQLKKLMGETIKKWGIRRISEDFKGIDDMYIRQETIDRYTENQDTDEFVWRRDRICTKSGKILYSERLQKLYGDRKMPKYTAKKLIKDSPELDINCIDDIYSFIGHMFVEPALMNITEYADYNYQVDLFSAYPHILAYGKLPISGRIYNKPSDERLNFYEVIHSDVVEPDSIVTENLAQLLKDNGDKVEFIFSMNCQKGCKAGTKLIQAAYKDKEEKSATKDVHWGFLRRPYIERVYSDTLNTSSSLVRNPENVYEPLMCAIYSDLMYIMLKLRKNILGDIHSDSFILCDALFYSGEDHIEEIKRTLSEEFADYHLDYRIYQKTNDSWKKEGLAVLYKSYEELKTKRQNRNHRYYEAHKKNK